MKVTIIQPLRTRRVLLVALLLTAMAGNLFVPQLQPSSSAQQVVTLSVDAAASRRPISPYIYGVNFGTQELAAEVNYTVNRWGGNFTSRYDWKTNIANAGRDYYFKSNGVDWPWINNRTADQLSASRFIEVSKAVGADSMITFPMIGWLGTSGASFPRSKYPNQTRYENQNDQGVDFRPPGPADGGNGYNTCYNERNEPYWCIIPEMTAGNANALRDSTYQQEWAQSLVSRFGAATSGGVRYYILDNEPDLWAETHRDARLTPLNTQNYRDQMIEYAAKLKAADPGAQIVGPELSGWLGTIRSPKELKDDWRRVGWDLTKTGDYVRNGNLDAAPYVLQQFRQEEQRTGRRLLDVFSLHVYPSDGEFFEDEKGEGTANVSAEEYERRRNRTTRKLWDPAYTEDPFAANCPAGINWNYSCLQPPYNKIALVPTMKRWVNEQYPGTKTAITEYNWGGVRTMSGATAQADILGIFGREGLDIATLWEVPDKTLTNYLAFKMYRNYDGQKSTFGETSVKADTPNADEVSIFAAQRSSDNALTVMVINKVRRENAVTVNLANFNHQGTANVWQAAQKQITARPQLTISNNQINATVPAQSVTLFVIPADSGTSGCSPVAGSGNGLKAEYFNNDLLSGMPMLTRTDATINFNWGAGNPGGGLANDRFSARWSGQIEAPCSGEYTFYTTSDDGVRLFVNNQAVISNWTDHAPTTNTGRITLQGGQRYDIRVEFYERGGGALAKLEWQGGGRPREIVPTTRLYSGAPPARTVTVQPSCDRDDFATNDGTFKYMYCSQWETIFLKFPLAGTVSGEILSARLRLFRADAALGTLTLTPGTATSDNWCDGSTNLKQLLGAAATSLQVISSARGWVEFDVSLLVRQAAASGKVSLTVRGSGNPWQAFHTKENPEFKPELIVTFR